jgi:hypothetical protein
MNPDRVIIKAFESLVNPCGKTCGNCGKTCGKLYGSL